MSLLCLYYVYIMSLFAFISSFSYLFSYYEHILLVQSSNYYITFLIFTHTNIQLFVNMHFKFTLIT